jgi:hydrogenase-4 membrane subunit HyfE
MLQREWSPISDKLIMSFTMAVTVTVTVTVTLSVVVTVTVAVVVAVAVAVALISAMVVFLKTWTCLSSRMKVLTHIIFFIKGWLQIWCTKAAHC